MEKANQAAGVNNIRFIQERVAMGRDGAQPDCGSLLGPLRLV